MLWRYIGLVLSFAFRRTTNAIDGAQVVIASAIPAVAMVARVHTPSDIGSRSLAYIGLAAVTLLLVRLASAPFFIWRENQTDLDRLREELLKPNRIELKSLAKKRAKARLQIAKLTGKIRWELAFLPSMEGQDDRDEKGNEIQALIGRAMEISGLLTTSVTINAAFHRIHQGFVLTRSGKSTDAIIKNINTICVLLVQFLHGEISADALRASLPPDITVVS